MSSTSAIALSGLQASQLALQGHAHNLANLGTADFRRSGVAQSTVAAGGTQARMARAEAPGHALATDLVGQLQEKNAFLVNLAVFRTSDRMAGALLDAIG
jgi:flagellar hook protein FlgE